MGDIKRHVDTWSLIVMFMTSVLFAVALFLKGLRHDLLLEAGVFLVSVKLIMMAYRNGVVATELKARLDGIHGVLTQLEGALQSAQSSGSGKGPDKSRKPSISPEGDRSCSE